MAIKRYTVNGRSGVWRTIGGRRVFIRDGDSLSKAMKDSGKFGKKTKMTDEELERTKHPKGLKTWNSVEERYNNDKSFRDMLKGIDDKYNDDKLMSRDEYESYASRIPDRADYAATSYQDYINATKDVGSIKQVNDSIKNYDGYAKSKNPLESMANDRIKEKQNTLNNDRILLDGMRKRGMTEIAGSTTKDIERDINKNAKYLGTADSDIPEWMEVGNKSVQDSDGFSTDYTLYLNTKNGKMATVFGDKDLYNVDTGTDMDFDTPEEAWDWFNNYTGFEEAQKNVPKNLRMSKNDLTDNDRDVLETARKKFNLTDDDDLVERAWQHHLQEAKDRGITPEELSKIKTREGLKREGMLVPIDPYKPEDEAKRIVGGKKKTSYWDNIKAGKVDTAGKSNRKEVSNNIQAHIKDYYDSAEDFVNQMEAMKDSQHPTAWSWGQEYARGGGYLIYNSDMEDFLNTLNINPKGKKFNDEQVFNNYTALVGRESAKMYDNIRKEAVKTLSERYSGTIDYLKQTENMSTSEILELLKKMEK